MQSKSRGHQKKKSAHHVQRILFNNIKVCIDIQILSYQKQKKLRPYTNTNIYIYILLKYDKIVKYSHPRLISLPRSNKIGMGSGYFIFFFYMVYLFLIYIYLQKKERTRRLAPPLFIQPIYFDNNVMCLPLPAKVNIHLISPQRINAAFGDSQTAFGLYGN